MLNVLFFMYMFHMYVVFVILSVMSISFYYLDLIVILEWLVFEFNTMNLKFILLMDWISMLFISFISFMMISMIMLYSIVYMSSENT